MDNELVRVLKSRSGILLIVLILILMDNELVLKDSRNLNAEEQGVLILILMDNELVQVFFQYFVCQQIKELY